MEANLMPSRLNDDLLEQKWVGKDHLISKKNHILWQTRDSLMNGNIIATVLTKGYQSLSQIQLQK